MPSETLPAVGRIDIHCHLIPGVDDGCETVEQSLASIAMLKEKGYVGSICTPHLWPDLYPGNTSAHVKAWTAQLQQAIDAAGVEYQLWAGGELRLYDDVVAWMKDVGVPTLAGSNAVLFDYWLPEWPSKFQRAIEWLQSEGYQPINAHPERTPASWKVDGLIERLADMGVWFQGNCKAFTGEDGREGDRLVRQWVEQGVYRFMALDAHRPPDLSSRLDGLTLLEMEFGEATTARLVDQAPRALLGV